MTHRLKKFRFEMFLIHTTRKSQGFSKLYTLKIVLKRLLFSGQITMDGVPNQKKTNFQIYAVLRGRGPREASGNRFVQRKEYI